jgi:DNA uptake protein ComE-like DNA-binding protein
MPEGGFMKKASVLAGFLTLVFFAHAVIGASVLVAAQTRETGTVPEMNAAAGQGSSASAKSKAPAGEKLDINSATKEQLDALPGIGDAYAQKSSITAPIVPSATWC